MVCGDGGGPIFLQKNSEHDMQLVLAIFDFSFTVRTLLKTCLFNSTEKVSHVAGGVDEHHAPNTFIIF